MKIAVLMTCHNRREKTIECLHAVYLAKMLSNYELSVFLVDDGSTDGTYEAVHEMFSKVNIINGSGNLFWNQGMRLAWKTAAKEQEYDYYLWLNDDTVIDSFAIEELLECNVEAVKKDGKSAIICGACRESDTNELFSYGGRVGDDEVIPNGQLQKCTYINGNIVLIPNKVFNKLGNLSPDYTHAMGDFDYGLRAIDAEVNSYTTKKYIAVCPRNEAPQWSDSRVALKKRLKLFYSPRGLNYKEYILFRKNFWGIKWISFAVKAYAKVLFPSIYNTIKR